MARSKTLNIPENIPASVLKQHYEDNSVDDTKDYPLSSHPAGIDTCEGHSISAAVANDNFDFDLINVVKEDLKQNIHRRRQEKGLGEVDYDEDLPRSYQLTDTEQRKRQLRKDRNRVAAAKCRDKKRQQTVQLMKETEHLEKRNRALQEQAEQLKTEKEYLQQMLQEHLAVCPKGRSGCR